MKKVGSRSYLPKLYFVVATPKKQHEQKYGDKISRSANFRTSIKIGRKWSFNKLVKERKSDHYYNAFKSWTHLVTMLFGILSRCDSMAETCEGLRAMSGKLNQLGLEKAPAKSSAGDGLRNRNESFFEALYYQLADQLRVFCRTAERWD